MTQCKAKSKRSQQQCKNHAVRGRKTCRMHGGILGGKKSLEARRKAVLKHGFYTTKAINERKKVSKFYKEIKNRIEN